MANKVPDTPRETADEMVARIVRDNKIFFFLDGSDECLTFKKALDSMPARYHDMVVDDYVNRDAIVAALAKVAPGKRVPLCFIEGKLQGDASWIRESLASSALRERLVKLGCVWPTFEPSEVKKHTVDGDCWMTFNRSVYDLSRFVQKHPGGVEPLLREAGGDGLDAFNSVNHPDVAVEMRETYKIGILPSWRPDHSDVEGEWRFRNKKLADAKAAAARNKVLLALFFVLLAIAAGVFVQQ